jgi:hypothetical protein
MRMVTTKVIIFGNDNSRWRLKVAEKVKKIERAEMLKSKGSGSFLGHRAC